MSFFLSTTKNLLEILNEVLRLKRSLEYKEKNDRITMGVPWITTFGPGHGELRAFVRTANSKLLESPLYGAHNEQNPVLKVVSRRAPCLRNKLFNQKKIGLNISTGRLTTRCTLSTERRVGRPCQACNLMSDKSEIVVNGLALVLTGGNCKTFNLVYCAQCEICGLSYFGKSVQTFSNRIAQHRGFIKSIGLEDETDDTNTLAHHILKHHGAKTPEDFNKMYRFSVVRVSDPLNLLKLEQGFINDFNTLKPCGLNHDNPINLGGIL